MLFRSPGSDRLPVELFQILKDDAVESAALNMQYALNRQYAGSLHISFKFHLNINLSVNFLILPSYVDLLHLKPYIYNPQ